MAKKHICNNYDRHKVTILNYKEFTDSVKKNPKAQ